MLIDSPAYSSPGSQLRMGIVPNRGIRPVNVIFVCERNALYAGSEHGGEEKRKGRKAVGFEQGT
jgi:hypothetical protein